mgnify:CR=1 FL=1
MLFRHRPSFKQRRGTQAEQTGLNEELRSYLMGTTWSLSRCVPRHCGTFNMTHAPNILSNAGLANGVLSRRHFACQSTYISPRCTMSKR